MFHKRAVKAFYSSSWLTLSWWDWWILKRLLKVTQRRSDGWKGKCVPFCHPFKNDPTSVSVWQSSDVQRCAAKRGINLDYMMGLFEQEAKLVKRSLKCWSPHQLTQNANVFLMMQYSPAVTAAGITHLHICFVFFQTYSNRCKSIQQKINSSNIYSCKLNG